MNVVLGRAEIALGARRFLRLDDALGTRIVCLAGELWITQDRDTDDHFVAAGESFTIDAAGTVLIQAQQPSQVALIEADAAAQPRWLTRWLGAARLNGAAPAIVRVHGA